MFGFVKAVILWLVSRVVGAAKAERNSNGATGGTVGERPQQAGTDVISSHPQGGGLENRNRELKVTCGGCFVRLAGAEREPVAEVFYRLDCARNRRNTMVQLTMDQVDFGVKNCCTRNCSARNQACEKNCKTVFVYKLTIEARPKSWAQDCHRLLLQPHRTAEVFELQRSSTVNFQMPLVCPRQASITYQTGNSVSHPTPAFGWSPGCRDDASNSVSWTWELYRYTDGRRLKLNKVSWGNRPVLAIPPDHMHIHPGFFVAKASWEVQPNVELQQERLEWDVKISLHTAVLQSKRRLPRYSVARGPMVRFDRVLAF